MSKKLHVVTAGMVTDRLDAEVRVANALVNDALKEMSDKYGKEAPVEQKLLAGIAGFLDTLLTIHMTNFLAQYTDDEQVVFVRPCGAPTRCRAPHVTPDDLIHNEDGTTTAIRIRHEAPDLDKLSESNKYLDELLGGGEPN